VYVCMCVNKEKYLTISEGKISDYFRRKKDLKHLYLMSVVFRRFFVFKHVLFFFTVPFSFIPFLVSFPYSFCYRSTRGCDIVHLLSPLNPPHLLRYVVPEFVLQTFIKLTLCTLILCTLNSLLSTLILCTLTLYSLYTAESVVAIGY